MVVRRGGVATGIWLLLAMPGPSAETVSTPEMRSDAELHDVCFVDAQHGWAVGDRGAIWATADGGSHWRLQAAPTDCRLQSVWFVDRAVGWAVGSRVHAYTHETTAVVLRTRDGGGQWVETPRLTLPGLKRVKFFDQQEGWAIGDASVLFPSGLFRTRDGGRTWTTAPAGQAAGLLTGDFFNPDQGALAGQLGELLMVRGPHVAATQTPDLGRRHLRCLRVAGESSAWLAGDKGLLMRTSDAGRSWQLAGPPVAESAGFDLAAVAAFGPHVWVAGAPGTRVFHSHDEGRTWQAGSTRQSLPLRALHFVSETEGWAVGSLGTILATRDGGQTWLEQRQGGRRAALFGIFAAPQRVPLELLSHAAGEDGYLTVVESLVRRDLERPPSSGASLDERVSECVIRCGGVHGRQSSDFPLRQPGIELTRESIARLWSQVNDGNGPAAVEAHLVRQIRQWRPDVIVVDGDSDPEARLIQQIASTAVLLAAEPTSHLEQLTDGGLRPWQVKKVFSCAALDAGGGSPRGSGNVVSIVSGQVAPNLGATLAEHADRARGLLHDGPGPPGYQLTLLSSELARDVAERGLFRGLNLPPGGEARRKTSVSSARLDQLARRAQVRKNIESLIDRTLAPSLDADESGGAGGADESGGAGETGGAPRRGAAPQGVLADNPYAAEARLGQIGELTNDLPADGAARMLFQLAQRFLDAGRLEMAAAMHERLVQQHADHDLAAPSLAWLIRFYASGEAAWRLRSDTVFAVQAASHVAPQPPARDRDATTPGILDPRIGGEVVRAGAVQTAAGDASLHHRWKRSLELGELARRSLPNLYAQPQIRLPLAAAQRGAGEGRDGSHYFQSIAARDAQGAWWRVARGELWLTAGQDVPPTAVYACVQAETPPYLDGRLDDPIWEAAQPIPLTSGQHDDEAWPAVARLAWDQRYLYWSARCAKAPRQAAPEPRTDSEPPPQRDSLDIERHDRVMLLLDVDRDYTTFFRLQADRRGGGADDCLGDRTWNPKWHFACRREEGEWILEAAIPWDSLTPQPPSVNHAWACGLQRVAPEAGVQSWNQPAAVEPLAEGFGLLIFR